MDKINHDYQENIAKILQEYADFLGQDDSVQIELILDKENNHYLLTEIGWDKGQRIYGVLIHIDIINDKIWIQQDGTEEGIAEELVNRGIAKKYIVLAYKSIQRRQITEFAVN